MKNTPFVYNSDLFTVHDSTGQIVAYLGSGSAYEVPAIISDRHGELFASSPDLLEALIACKKYMNGEYTELDLVETDRMAETAIRKATE